MAVDNQIFKITFSSQNQIYELYAKEVYQSDLYGFIVVEELIFGENSGVLVDPSEEKLKAEFQGVKRSFIPMHEIIRIDEVERRGTAKILPVSQDGNNGNKVSSIYRPEKK